MPGLRENITDVLTREPKIDPEFSSLIPPLTPEEYSGLEQSILSEGCRDAIILWDNIIIDGHNRYKICKEHNIPFRTETKDFESREDVILWMFRNQLSRRNLNDFQRIEIVRRYEHTVRAQAEQRMLSTLKQNQDTVRDICLTRGRATDELGAMAGVSRKTYEYATEIINKATEAVIQAVRKNKLSIHSGYITTTLPPEQQAEISFRINKGEKPAQVVSDVRKRNAAESEALKDLTIHLTPDEYKQLKRLARINHTDTESMITTLVQEALKTINTQN